MRLFLSNLKMGRGGLITWMSLLLIYGLFAIYMYPTVSKSNMDYLSYIASMPEAMRMGLGLGSLDLTKLSFSSDVFVAVEFLMFWPIVVAFYAIFAGVGLAREQERGTLDLLLAQPVSRMRVLASRYGTLVLGTLAIALASWGGVALGIPLADTSVSLTNLGLALLTGVLLVLAIGSFTLLMSVVFLEPRKALVVAGGLTAVMYILNFIVPVLGDSLKWLSKLSFFYHYNAVEIARQGTLSGTALTIYLTTFVVCALAAFLIFRRRDLTAG